MNELCKLLGIRFPIIQAPTGSVAGPELAAAVSMAGGLGSMGFTWTPQTIATENVNQVTARTSAPFAVNYVLWFKPESLGTALEAGARIVTFSWGVPKEEMKLARSFGAKVGIQVGSIDGGARAADLIPDFLICQGVGAGGHIQSTHDLWELLPNIVERCPTIPIVAAGGIADGAGIARAIRLGASGAMLGTRFVATEESRAHETYKRRIEKAESADTALTVCFDGGWPHAPHRTLRNSTLDEWEAAGCPPPGRRPGEGDVIGRGTDGSPIFRYEDTAPRADMTGNPEEMALYCGIGVASIVDSPPASVVVSRLLREALDVGVDLEV